MRANPVVSLPTDISLQLLQIAIYSRSYLFCVEPVESVGPVDSVDAVDGADAGGGVGGSFTTGGGEEPAR